MANRKYAEAVKQEAERLYRTGFSNADIALKMEIPVGTLVKWFAMSELTRGDLLAKKLEKAREENELASLPDASQSTDARHVHKILEHATEISDSANSSMSGEFEEGYRKLTLERLLKHMDTSLVVPPRCKTIADLQRLDTIIQNISGMNRTSHHARKGGRLYIDVEALGKSPRAKEKIEEAEIIEKEEDEDD